MKKEKILFYCVECGFETPKWLGKCPECHHWNSFQEEKRSKIQKEKNFQSNSPQAYPKIISEITSENFQRSFSGIQEFDRVMGGGITVGSMNLIGGEPGVGKSTLLMEVCGKLSNLNGCRILYASGEESEAQVAQRARRLGVDNKNFFIFQESNLERIFEEAKKIHANYLVIDSIQTIFTDDVQSSAGSATQVREVTYSLLKFSKTQKITTFIIGHVTKEGNIAGPKILEHMVDTVVYFEGEQYANNRILRAIKNRFGNTNEVGLFQISEGGLKEIKNPTLLFIENSLNEGHGRSLTCITEGTRSLFIEIQALVVENKFNLGRRTTQGIDSNRLSLLLAIIDKHFQIPLSFNDIYVNIVGGIKISGRESDLAIIVSLLSSYFGIPVPHDAIFIGEVGLSGEVRPVNQMDIRLKEASLMGFNKVYTFSTAEKEMDNNFNLEVIRLSKASELKGLIFNQS